MLDAPLHLRKECLEPTRFRASRFGDLDRRREDHLPGLPEECDWIEQADRCGFLGDPSQPRLCLVVDAGVGKTTALEQAAFIRHHQPDGHVAMFVQFGELPDCSDEYLDGGDRVLANRFKTVLISKGGSTQFGELDLKALADYLRIQIHGSRLTLMVDGLDQVASEREGRIKARALAEFLNRYPRTHCMVSGRPAAVMHVWNHLFAKESTQAPWQFALLDVFSREEAETFVTPERFAKLQRLEADALLEPRMLENVRAILPHEMDDIRTASDIYWRALDATLRKAFEGQPSRPVTINEARKLFALLAFEMTRRGNFYGVELGEQPGQFESFIAEVWRDRKDQLEAYENRRDFQAALDAIGELNVYLEFAVLDHHGMSQLFWQNRTLQDFFAALWITRWASEDDRASLGNHLFVRADDRTSDYYGMWRLATEMPGRTPEVTEPARFDEPYLDAMSALYQTTASVADSLCQSEAKPGVTPVRSTEMIYRSWPSMLKLAGYLRAGWNQHDLNAATWRAQRDARRLAKRRNVTDDIPDSRGPDEPPLEVRQQARRIVLEFLAEFPRIGRGIYGPVARRIAREFLGGFRRVPPRAEDSLDFWMSNEPRWEGANRYGQVRESRIDRPFRLARHPVTNGLYALFDNHHETRFDAYAQYSPQPECPVISLDWYDAWSVALWLGGRLPTEHEWECACRAQPGRRQDVTVWWFGDEEDDLGKHAWFVRNSEHHTHPVGQQKEHANRFGLCDMAGNVWEWTASWFHYDPEEGRKADFVGTLRVLRGGSFLDYAFFCRSAVRNYRVPSYTDFVIGVRVARSVCPSAKGANPVVNGQPQ